MAVRTEKKRTKSAEERRQDLIDAAIALFKDKGIRSTTVADIAEAAGVAKGTFYLYFDSREHLLATLRQSLVDQTLERTAELYARVGKDDWWAIVDAMVGSMIDLMFDRRDVIEVFMQEGLTPHTAELFAECDRRVNQMIASGIQAGVEAGAFRVADPFATAALLHHALEGAILEAILYEPGFDKAQLAAAAREMVHKALAP